MDSIGSAGLEIVDVHLSGSLADEVDEVLAGEVLAGEVLAGEVLAGEVLAGEVLAGEVLALAGEVLAGEVLAGEVLAGEVLAGEVLALAGEVLADEGSLSLQSRRVVQRSGKHQVLAAAGAPSRYASAGAGASSPKPTLFYPSRLGREGLPTRLLLHEFPSLAASTAQNRIVDQCYCDCWTTNPGCIYPQPRHCPQSVWVRAAGKMSSFAGDGDSLGQEGRGKTLNIGKSFIKRIAYRIRGGAATPETNAAPEEPPNDFVLEVERDRAAPSEPKAIPTSVRYVESNVSEILPQPGSNANLIIPIKYVRGEDRHERTRRLLAKYGLSVEAQDWMPAISNYPATVLRVEKQIRMRVRFTCHLCEHIFGANRNCKTCNHKRCEACPRHPSKRRLESKSREETDRENLTRTNLAKENLTITTDVVSTRKREHEEMESLTRSRSRGKMQASEDAPIPVMQSLQHSCHKCNITFEQRGRLERTHSGLNACIDHRGKGYGGYVIIAETLLQRDQKCVANVFTNGVRPVEGFPRKD
ncbi:hypothetical protein E2P81_ATG03647 [Venturia nashicola]|nr:hypothetical protein E2P81_ATG03647 [Venturia nashicola]